jgi:hypothetical protein
VTFAPSQKPHRVHEAKLLPPPTERHPYVILEESLHRSLAGAAYFADLRQRSIVARVGNEYLGDPDRPGVGRIGELQRHCRNGSQLVEYYIYQVALRLNILL